MLEERHQQKFDNFDRNAAPEPKQTRSLVKKNHSERPEYDNYRSREKLEEFGAKSGHRDTVSNTDMSLSSTSKAQQTQKR